MARNFYKDRFAVKGRRARQNRDEIDSGSFEDSAVDAFNLRRDANEAANSATDQYEADVAAFKATEATAAEEGIASLPQYSGDDRDMMDSGSYDDSFIPPPVDEPSFYVPPPPVETNPYDGYAGEDRDAGDSGSYGDVSLGSGTVYSGGTPVPPGYGDPYYDYNNNVYSEERDLSSGTDGMVNMFGDTEAYGGEVINPDPIYIPPPPVEEEPIFMPRPPIDDGRPRNIYTGRPIRDPYVPYEEPSEEMAEYTRPMSAENFGSTPGMGPQINPPREPIFANNGGNLDKGLSRLPLNEQNDTLTQIFQAGFRPRR